MYFVHHFHYQQPLSDFFRLIAPLLNKLPYDQSRLSRVKGNMYPSMKEESFMIGTLIVQYPIMVVYSASTPITGLHVLRMASKISREQIDII